MKFGGTSVADAERLKRAARRIVRAREQGHNVVAVLSARGQMTDELVAMAEEVSPSPDPREMDMLLSTGERMSCALCAMAINDLGHRAISLTGLAGRHRHRHDAHEGAHPRRARRPHPQGRSTNSRSCSSRASRASRRPTTSPRSAAAARTRPPSRSPRRWTPRCARSTPTSPACSAPTRGSSPTRASCRSSRSRRCSRWPPRAPACCSCARSSTHATTACASTADRRSTRTPVPLSWARKRPWNDH